MSAEDVFRKISSKDEEEMEGRGQRGWQRGREVSRLAWLIEKEQINYGGQGKCERESERCACYTGPLYDRSSTIYRVLYLLWIYSVFMKHQTSKWQKQPRDDEECYEEWVTRDGGKKKTWRRGSIVVPACFWKRWHRSQPIRVDGSKLKGVVSLLSI